MTKKNYFNSTKILKRKWTKKNGGDIGLINFDMIYTSILAIFLKENVIYITHKLVVNIGDLFGNLYYIL
jgi:hypothetical protein